MFVNVKLGEADKANVLIIGVALLAVVPVAVVAAPRAPVPDKVKAVKLAFVIVPKDEIPEPGCVSLIVIELVVVLAILLATKPAVPAIFTVVKPMSFRFVTVYEDATVALPLNVRVPTPFVALGVEDASLNASVP